MPILPFSATELMVPDRASRELGDQPLGEEQVVRAPVPLAEACERLAQAVLQLEEALDIALAVAAPPEVGPLEAARAEVAALRDSQRMLAERLDGAIARLRALLGGSR